MSLWPVSDPRLASCHQLLYNAGCHDLQHLDLFGRGPGLCCGLLPRLPTSQSGLARNGRSESEGWRGWGLFHCSAGPTSPFQRLFLAWLPAPGNVHLRQHLLLGREITASPQPACRGPWPSLVPCKAAAFHATRKRTAAEPTMTCISVTQQLSVSKGVPGKTGVGAGSFGTGPPSALLCALPRGASAPDVWASSVFGGHTSS